MERFLFKIKKNIIHSLLPFVDLKVETSPMSKVIFLGFYEEVYFFHMKEFTVDPEQHRALGHRPPLQSNICKTFTINSLC